MTLARIIYLAIRQLDEDPADASDYDDIFKVYLNEGYQIVMRDAYKPRERIELVTDENGTVVIAEKNIIRVVELKDVHGRNVWFDLSADGTQIHTNVREKTLYAVAEICAEMMVNETDEPAFPEWAHCMLADYICYRHLSSGSVVKQQRAQFFLQRFNEMKRRLRPQGMGSVTQFYNLYVKTDVKCV